MFPARMTLSQPSVLFGTLEELQELAFIERPIRRSLKVLHSSILLLITRSQPAHSHTGNRAFGHTMWMRTVVMMMMMVMMVMMMMMMQRGDPLCAQHDALSAYLPACVCVCLSASWSGLPGSSTLLYISIIASILFEICLTL